MLTTALSADVDFLSVQPVVEKTATQMIITTMKDNINFLIINSFYLTKYSQIFMQKYNFISIGAIKLEKNIDTL
ncbi:hypothetical protein prwr041_01470 [Prevotella herbatica]|uniref:Uncharacterized protein n=1 Tax=Prevotella herbatica TaxID=2801997 RepID=A0ABM7NUT1_9BACT|nr:hypothetical protein prwr041_01470 [Prevotella herbatica]